MPPDVMWGTSDQLGLVNDPVSRGLLLFIEFSHHDHGGAKAAVHDCSKRSLASSSSEMRSWSAALLFPPSYLSHHRSTVAFACGQRGKYCDAFQKSQLLVHAATQKMVARIRCGFVPKHCSQTFSSLVKSFQARAWGAKPVYTNYTLPTLKTTREK